MKKNTLKLALLLSAGFIASNSVHAMFGSFDMDSNFGVTIQRSDYDEIFDKIITASKDYSSVDVTVFLSEIAQLLEKVKADSIVKIDRNLADALRNLLKPVLGKKVDAMIADATQDKDASKWDDPKTKLFPKVQVLLEQVATLLTAKSGNFGEVTSMLTELQKEMVQATMQKVVLKYRNSQLLSQVKVHKDKFEQEKAEVEKLQNQVMVYNGTVSQELQNTVRNLSLRVLALTDAKQEFTQAQQELNKQSRAARNSLF